MTDWQLYKDVKSRTSVIPVSGDCLLLRTTLSNNEYFLRTSIVLFWSILYWIGRDVIWLYFQKWPQFNLWCCIFITLIAKYQLGHWLLAEKASYKNGQNYKNVKHIEFWLDGWSSISTLIDASWNLVRSRVR